MKISICNSDSDAGALAGFFSANITHEYISHAELQGYRALRLGEWAPDLEEVLRAEIAERLGARLASFPSDAAWKGVIEARDEDGLVGVALVTISRDAHVPFGIVEDVIVDGRRRSKGDGETLMNWMIDNFQRAGVRRIFLESGIANEAAHRFFERLGFKAMSVVMIRES